MKHIIYQTIRFIALASILSTIFLPIGSVKALSGSDFRADHIIDDNVFFNTTSMDTNSIQAFLNSKVPVCDTNGDLMYGGVTRRDYSIARGISMPLICLRNFTADTPARSAETNLCNAVNPGTGISGAEIIYRVSQSCGINPQVLLVLLQKEQSLITDDWPWPIQYQSATGYGCPDTAACDSTYYGFFNQVYMAARQFKKYARDSGQFNYRANSSSYILFNPNSGCGGTTLYIQNQATANLYNYTPYQPNNAALNNLNGTGDGCSSYGNRNFWKYFNDWFGSTYGSYNWSTNGFVIYDQSKTTKVDPGALEPGQIYNVQLTAHNTGTANWSNTGSNQVLLASAKNSIFCSNGWISCNRPALLKESIVTPGQDGHFEFYFQAPYKPGNYRESFKPVSELLSWFNDYPPFDSFGITVLSPGSFSWSTSGYQIFNQSKTSQVDPGTLQPGQTYYARITSRNTGSAIWKNNGPSPVLLGTTGATSSGSTFCQPSWPSCNRPALLQETSVAPGQDGHFEFAFKAKNTPGSYRESFKPVAEFFSWFNDTPNEEFGVWTVSPGTFTWSTSGYTIKDMSNAQVDPGQLQTNQTYQVSVTARNTGTATWTNSGPIPVYLAASSPTSRTSSLCDVSWPSCNRPALLQETSVAPGQDGHFQFVFKAPATPGQYRESFKPVSEFFSWFNDYKPNDEFGVWVR